MPARMLGVDCSSDLVKNHCEGVGVGRWEGVYGVYGDDGGIVLFSFGCQRSSRMRDVARKSIRPSALKFDETTRPFYNYWD